MDSITSLAASGLRSRWNHSNYWLTTSPTRQPGGIKADREFYGLYISQEATDAGSTSTMPVIETQWTDYSQGELRVTDNPGCRAYGKRISGGERPDWSFVYAQRQPSARP